MGFIVRVFTPTHINVSVTFLGVVEDMIRAFSRPGSGSDKAQAQTTTSGTAPSHSASLVPSKPAGDIHVKKSVAFYDDFNERKEQLDMEVGCGFPDEK
jgi:hypothetical protein